MSGLAIYERASSSGTKNSVQQVFYNNKWVQMAMPDTKPFTFNVPQGNIVGGTENYYAQIPDGIFTSIARPFFRFSYTGNTDSFSNEVNIIHNIYAIDFTSYQNFTNVEEVKTVLQTPVLSISANTSGFTDSGFIYDFQPPEYYKQLGNFKKTLLQDKGQYFITSTFSFNWDKSRDGIPPCIDRFFINENGVAEEGIYQQVEKLETYPNTHVISAETNNFSGATVQGRYFTFFTIPNTPQIILPTTGVTNSLSPIFEFSEAADGDETFVEISYNTSDTEFEGIINTYYFTGVFRNTGSLVSKSQNFTLLNNREFIFRIGNRKNLLDIFGVKRSVVTYSQTKIAQTPDIISTTTIEAESDYPGNKNIPEPGVPPSVVLAASDPIGNLVLSGTVSGSTVTGATITLKYPSGFETQQLTDTFGNYSFSGLSVGTYGLIADYRGYKIETKTVNLVGNTNFGFKIKLIWGNKFDTLGDIGNEIIGEN